MNMVRLCCGLGGIGNVGLQPRSEGDLAFKFHFDGRRRLNLGVAEAMPEDTGQICVRGLSAHYIELWTIRSPQWGTD